MIRTIITPDKPFISLDIPREYVGKEIEVIAFSKDEGMDEIFEPKKKVSYNAVNIDTRGYVFNRDGNGQQIEGILTIKNPFDLLSTN